MQDVQTPSCWRRRKKFFFFSAGAAAEKKERKSVSHFADRTGSAATAREGDLGRPAPFKRKSLAGPGPYEAVSRCPSVAWLVGADTVEGSFAQLTPPLEPIDPESFSSVTVALRRGGWVPEGALVPLDPYKEGAGPRVESGWPSWGWWTGCPAC